MLESALISIAPFFVYFVFFVVHSLDL